MQLSQIVSSSGTSPFSSAGARKSPQFSSDPSLSLLPSRMTFLPAVRVVDSSPVYQLKILLIAGAVFENTTFPMETLEMESLSTCEAENFIVSVSSETSLAESSATLPLAPMYSLYPSILTS